VFWLASFLLHHFVLTSLGSGQFQLRIISYRAERAELADGSCCDVTDSNPSSTIRSVQTLPEVGRLPTTYRCNGHCNVFFRVCLKEYLIHVSPNGNCTFGNASSEARLRGTFDVTRDVTDVLNYSFDLPFDFAWTVSCEQLNEELCTS